VCGYVTSIFVVLVYSNGISMVCLYNIGNVVEFGTAQALLCSLCTIPVFLSCVYGTGNFVFLVHHDRIVVLCVYSKSMVVLYVYSKSIVVVCVYGTGVVVCD